MARTPTTTASRRGFLRGMLTLGGAAAVFGRGRNTLAAPSGEPAPADTRDAPGTRYRLTPHVRRYYETSAR